MKYTVVTTFNKKGYDLYGKRMIDSFLKNWPAEVTLYVYAEGFNVAESAPNLVVHNLNEASPKLVAFKERWKNDPRATGDNDTDPSRADRKDGKKAFKWDAIRFAHKVYAIFACAEEVKEGILIWMDGDNYCHSPISIDTIQRLIPEQFDLSYLGRGKKYTECGLYSMNLDHNNTRKFLSNFEQMYEDAEHGIFTLKEWHDSYVFDIVKNRMTELYNQNWSEALEGGEGHPLINTEWGAYLDHLKGKRKELGRSKAKDLRVNRTEPYWQ